MGLFGRSEAQETAQLTAAYSTWFDRLYGGECQRRGVADLSLEVLHQIHRVALEMAMSQTYKLGQRIRVPNLEIQKMFRVKLQELFMQSLQRRPENGGGDQ
jgi:hypothetical protein